MIALLGKVTVLLDNIDRLMPIMPALCSMLLVTYYAFNYAGIIGRGLILTIGIDLHAARNNYSHYILASKYYSKLKNTIQKYNYKPHIPHMVNKVSEKSHVNTTINMFMVNNRDKNLNIICLQTTNYLLEILLF